MARKATLNSLKLSLTMREEAGWWVASMKVYAAKKRKARPAASKSQTPRTRRPLFLMTKAVAVARAHSTDMGMRGFFAHINPDQLDFDAKNAHTSLMNSQVHRDNILEPNFGRVGIGVYVAGPGEIFYTQVFAN